MRDTYTLGCTGHLADTPVLQLKPAEMSAIASIVGGNEGAKDDAYAEGLRVAGTRYVMAKAEGRSIYARAVRGPTETSQNYCER